MGYHRDAKHFSSISPFDGEMRRRVWAMIVQLDSSVSTQLGLPRLVKESDTNTAEPRNLVDSDFDEDISILPPSRPEIEVTPTLYVLTKLRLLSNCSLLDQSRWRVSSAFINDFLLATSVLFFYVQANYNKQNTTRGNSGVSETEPEIDRIKDLLRKSQIIWDRQSTRSREARKAVIALDHVLGDTLARIQRSAQESPSAIPARSVSYFPDYSDLISNYDMSGMSLGSTVEGVKWPLSPTNLNNDVDQWLRGTDFQGMDIRS
ncbi:fungal specific transcription factor domain protein [Penicillium herquei]|nr:fungal specific transcription factor domain protein [Penicillium herquei]